jgi:hypothetical protein
MRYDIKTVIRTKIYEPLYKAQENTAAAECNLALNFHAESSWGCVNSEPCMYSLACYVTVTPALSALSVLKIRICRRVIPRDDLVGVWSLTSVSSSGQPGVCSAGSSTWALGATRGRDFQTRWFLQLSLASGHW